MRQYLKIAVSGVSLIACVLLIVLWVRMYWQARFGLMLGLGDLAMLALAFYAVRITDLEGSWSTKRRYLNFTVTIIFIVAFLLLSVWWAESVYFPSYTFFGIGGNVHSLTWRSGGLIVDSFTKNEPLIELRFMWLMQFAFTLALVPWFISRRFSLSSLLIVMTVIAVILGIFAI